MDELKAFKKEFRDFRTEMEDRVRTLEKGQRIASLEIKAEVSADDPTAASEAVAKPSKASDKKP